MEFFDLVDISERNMEIVNPSTPEKTITIGKFLGLREGSRVIDFGCGYAEPLVLWAEQFGIVGTGIDVRAQACERASRKVSERGLGNRIEIVCADGADYRFEEHAYDAATCIGASFIWGGYRPTICAMRRAIHAEGRLGIGEPYWLRDSIPTRCTEQEPSVCREHELLHITREEDFDFEYVVRASHDDWDRYEADNWRGLIRWIEENPNHAERDEVISHLHKIQDEYLDYGREYMGWAMYVLAPRRYPWADATEPGAVAGAD